MSDEISLTLCREHLEHHSSVLELCYSAAAKSTGAPTPSVSDGTKLDAA